MHIFERKGGITQEGNNASSIINQLLQCRPLVYWQHIGTRRRHVAVRIKTRSLKGGAEIANIDIVAVSQEQGEDFIRVGIQPGLDRFKVAGQRARVFKPTACMAHFEHIAQYGHVRLALEEADAQVELRGDVDELVV